MRLSMSGVLVLIGSMLVGRSFANAAEPETVCGDVNGDAGINISDAVYLLNHLFLGGDAPVCLLTRVEDEEPSCGSFSRKATEACRHRALAEYWRARAVCDGLSGAADVAACRESARDELDSTLEMCDEQLETRLEVCERAGTPPYDRTIDPQDFSAGVENPYLPLAPGLTLIYESADEEGVRRNEVSVTDETREVLGVRCVVVRELETLDGVVVEETEEWFANDAEGNVWNFGERSFDFEDAEVADWGQWQAGVDGAQAGIVMKGEPRPGDVYYQELVLGVSEDVAEVLSVTESIPLSSGSFENCIQLQEFSVLEDEAEHKFFAPGWGMVLEVDLETGRRLELVERRLDSNR